MKSLLSQEDVELHIVIRDDGSTDGTMERLKIFIEQYPDRICISENENLGVVGSFFDLIGKASGGYDYYAFCDQDDVWNNDKLIRGISLINQMRPGQPLMYCSTTQMVDQYLNPLNIWPNSPEKPLSLYNALIENVCVGCTVLINEEALNMVRNKHPLNLENIIMHDWWIYLVVSTFGEVVFDSEPSILYRQHQSNALGGSTDDWMNKWKKRFKRFLKGQNHYILSNQAKEFMVVYAQEMNHEESNEIHKLIQTQQQNLFKRVIYIMMTPFYRQSTIDNLVFKMVLIAGKL
ncbi:glycosyl transferase [Paenibacillus glacialis]|uniref:Glycosyl transferase n=2 Tax=Paenibacillus glacialis TaxID=494026 RepID=A0A168L8R7_9BACL|nr:glycosyl transferase [Paenibacillus glacialis]